MSGTPTVRVAGADEPVRSALTLFRLPRPDAYVSLFTSGYGPAVAALAGLDETAGAAYRDDTLGLCHRFDEARDGTLKLRQDDPETVVRLPSAAP